MLWLFFAILRVFVDVFLFLSNISPISFFSLCSEESFVRATSLLTRAEDLLSESEQLRMHFLLVTDGSVLTDPLLLLYTDEEEDLEDDEVDDDAEYESLEPQQEAELHTAAQRQRAKDTHDDSVAAQRLAAERELQLFPALSSVAQMHACVAKAVLATRLLRAEEEADAERSK